jgi:hypothetical protein
MTEISKGSGPTPEQRKFLKSLSGDDEFRKDLIGTLSNEQERYDSKSVEYDEGRDIWRVYNVNRGRWEDIAIEFDFESWNSDSDDEAFS